VTVTEVRTAIARRVDAVAALRRVGWRNVLGIALVAGAIAGFSVATVRSATDLFLTPDGAHYIGDADALLGNGVRELRHPPVFPALVALLRPITGEANVFLWAMATALASLVVALYVLLRRWLPHGPSLTGAAAGGLTPVLAELFAWGGGATLLGVAMLVFTIAAMEWWIERGGRRGFLVGALLGLTALTHPFQLAVGVGVIGLRGLWLLLRERRIGTGWDPLGWRGMASVAAVFVPAFLVAYPLYFGPAVSFGAPRPRVAWDLFVWALKEGRGGWILAIAAAIGLQLSRHRAMIVYGISLFAIVLAFPALLRGDIIYANRAEYLVPVVIALGIGNLADLVARRMPASLREWLPRPSYVLAVAFGMLAFVTFLPRLEQATGYFNVWVTREDLPLLRSLQGEEGAVATSWRSSDYGTGVNLSWIVEGVAKREAFGAADASLSSIETQFEAGADMQRLFAGMTGIENGALQVAASPLGTAADLSVQIRSTGLAYPFVSLRTGLGSYPVEVTRSEARLEGDRLVWTFFDEGGEAAMTRTAWLDGKVVTIQYRLASPAEAGRWSFELEPAPGMTWSDLRRRGGAVEGTIGIRTQPVEFVVSTRDADIVPKVRGGSIRVLSVDASTLTLNVRIETPPNPPTGPVITFEETSLLDRYDISNVVVLRDTGLLPRFDRDPCFLRRGDNRRMVVYDVDPSCRASV
jgi:hypothetical protein